MSSSIKYLALAWPFLANVDMCVHYYREKKGIKNVHAHARDRVGKRACDVLVTLVDML